MLLKHAATKQYYYNQTYQTFSFWLKHTIFTMYISKQRDVTLSGFLFWKLYMFRAFLAHCTKFLLR
jgi:hypothetical protein